MIRELVSNIKFNSMMAIFLYWTPLLFCLVFYTVRTAQNYMKDKKNRETDPNHYYPTDTLGHVIGRIVASIMPIANIWAAIVDLGPKVFSSFFEWIGKVFDMPLVPRRKTDD